ncbi:TPA: polyamine ABC transporter substrate-binding protein, partial [Burkholderia stabilis]|nr:polyamine ABC transporter substrate-binding protein [Burkholderia stabilis]HDR9543495.1 polyamine ABC transporter substrate-binding protein [Burkholderia stabilis]HDR9558332.1 polyamine ABC transporter substrate-binding protein [Burkholderia stabilis]HDR9573597.1 polyamine ABC transporter substrate-binding protein [Burkholderia stabilis]HDR9581724.1 polyamine ABC transporter substrate-binding protein [Burkholderia stabilis]
MRLRTLRRAVSTTAILSAAAVTGTHAYAAGELNIYNWSDYIAPDTIPNFQKQTGLHVRYDNYDSDDTLQ